MKWFEPPRTRVAVIYHDERDDFEDLQEDGTPVDLGCMPYRIVRKRDGRVFRPATWLPREIEVAGLTRSAHPQYRIDPAPFAVVEEL